MPQNSQGGFKAWLRGVWTKLTTPTPHKPADYGGRRLSRFINEVLDGPGRVGASHRAELGESVSLVADHAIMGGRGGAVTPLGHLMGSTGEFVFNRWDEVKEAVELTAQQQAELMAQAANQDPPAPPG